MENMFAKKLGLENARKVIKALSKNEHFGFIEVSEEELANLVSMYTPSKMAAGPRDVFTFRAGIYMVMIVVYGDFVEVTMMNPYDPYDTTESCTTCGI